MKVLTGDPAASLQLALRANAVFSGFSGLVFILAPRFFATMVGIGSSGFLSLGINLLVFATLLAGLSTDRALSRTWAWVVASLVVVMDIVWVLGSLFLMSLPSMATDAGNIAILSIALVVFAFAVLQSIAIVRFTLARRRHRSASSAAVSVGTIVLILALSGCSLADIRTAPLRKATPDAAAQEKGRALLQATAEAHGLLAWKTYKTQEVVLVDAWQADSWWPLQEQRLALRTMTGTFTGHVSFLDGPMKGEQWGVQSWMAYRKDASGNVSVEPESSSPTAESFYIPSLQYFNELPFRMLRAELAAYAGEKIYRGATYDLVLATWGSFSPNDRHDQYVLWINRTTGLIAMCQYTLRDAAPAFTGTIHFEDYRDVQGVMFPFKQTVILPAPENTLYPLDEYFFHQSRVESVSFDGFGEDMLIVDASRKPADDKPFLEVE